MPSAALNRTSLSRSAWYRTRSARTSISSEMSSSAWPYLMAPARWCATFHSRSSVSVFTGAAAPSDASHALKSRFMPYLNTTEQSASLPFALSRPPHVDQSRKFFEASVATTLGMSAGSTMTAPCCFRTSMTSAIIFACAGFRPPRGWAAPGGFVWS